MLNFAMAGYFRLYHLWQIPGCNQFACSEHPTVRATTEIAQSYAFYGQIPSRHLETRN
jgi:hypothetical protein